MPQVNNTRMRQWMCGVTKKDNIRDEHVRGYKKVAPVTKKIAEKRLKWQDTLREGTKGTYLEEC